MYQFDSKVFSKKLKKAIKEAGYTQKQFADVSGVPVATLGSYLNDDKMPKAEALYRIAAALNTSIENLLDNEKKAVSKTITPKDIINAINTLTEAYGYDCIKDIEIEELDIDEQSGNFENINVCYKALCIKDDKRVQNYLKQLNDKGFLRFELSKVGENETFAKLLKEWANIDGCIFENGFIYNPSENEIIEKDSLGNLYVDKLPF